MNLFIYLKIAVIFLCSLGCHAQPESQLPKGPPENVASKGNITIYRNIRYGVRPNFIGSDSISDRILDLYIPAGFPQKLPVFLFIHGGGFKGGSKEGTEALFTGISSLGYAVVSINYRLTLKYVKRRVSAHASEGLLADGTFPPESPKVRRSVRNASEDTQMAMEWIKKNARKYNLEASSVVISGGSAGAMTALYTVYASRQKILPIKAVVALWGRLENVAQIKKNAPPVLIYHGDQDKTIHVDYAYAIKNQMDKIGNTQSELHVIEGKGHAIYNIIIKEKIKEIGDFLDKIK